MKRCFLLFAILIILLFSCKKDPEKLIVETWDIESVTFNGEEKKQDPSLIGIVKYDAGYDPYYKQSSSSYGSLRALNIGDASVLTVWVSFPNDKPDTLLCTYDPYQPPIAGSYLPGMIDSTFGSDEFWRVLELTNRKFSIQLIYKDNTYQVHMKKE